MAPTILFRWKGSGLKSTRKLRSAQEEELRGEGWGQYLTDEQLDKCKYVERKALEKFGSNAPVFVRQPTIEDVK